MFPSVVFLKSILKVQCALPVGKIVAEERSVRRPSVDTFIIHVFVVCFVVVGVVGGKNGHPLGAQCVMARKTNHFKPEEEKKRFNKIRASHKIGETASTVCVGTRKGTNSSSRCRNCENESSGAPRDMHKDSL
jgi:hypothetical protein